MTIMLYRCEPIDGSVDSTKETIQYMVDHNDMIVFPRMACLFTIDKDQAIIMKLKGYKVTSHRLNQAVSVIQGIVKHNCENSYWEHLLHDLGITDYE